MDAIATCQECIEDFDDDPAMADKRSSYLPIQSAKCAHRICCSCVRMIQMQTADELDKDPCDIKWIACPQCQLAECFDTEDPVVDKGRCDALRLLRGMQSNAAPGGETGQAAAAVSPAAAKNDSPSPGTRRAVKGEDAIPASVPSFSAGGQYDANTDDDSRFSEGEYEPTEDDEAAEPEKPSPKPKRARLSGAVDETKDGEDSVEDEMGDDGLELDDDAKKWLGLVSKDGVDVYRMRMFQAHSSNDDDPYGRKCAFWCIKNKCVASASLILTVLPEEIQKDGEACRDYVRNTDYEEFKETCRQCKAYYSLEQLKWCHTYRQFIEMKPGDIVALQIRGKRGGTPRPYLVFGVVCDDSLTLMSKDVATEEGFPWDFKQNGKPLQHFDNGLMLRKVKWFRQGILQDVRGSKPADWLIENITKWLVRVKGEDGHLLKKAIERMSSNDVTGEVDEGQGFFNSTKPIDDGWVDEEMLS